MVKSLVSSILIFVAFYSSYAQNWADDVHSYARPNEVRVKHVHLDWTVNFEKKKIEGFAVLTLERFNQSSSLMLDTKDLEIKSAEISADRVKFTTTKFQLGETDKTLGTPLEIQLAQDTKFVRISYSTSPQASGLQWLTPDQTVGKKFPFMYSQAQAIHARSFIPLQDSPQIRITYTATVRTPREMIAVMSAEGNLQSIKSRNGIYRFRMQRPIPPYLIAIAVGNLAFKSLGKRCGVFAEPEVIQKAATEFADTEKMMQSAERLYGPYRWGRYDILVLPPAFPFGGMENPVLTFVTPTIIAGDKSLVSVIAHELAHSWSGNLVTNATWRDFWLNEGFTTYIERRIIESIYGRNRSEMESMLGKQNLIEELKSLPASDQILHIDLKGRDPDDAFSSVPYEKGALFLRWLEQRFGRSRFDPFLKKYFNTHSFQSITTQTFVNFLKKNLIETYPGIVSIEEVNEWLEKPGIPKNAPNPYSENFARVENLAKSFVEGKISAKQISTKEWSTHEWLHFLRAMPEKLSFEKMEELDKAFKLTNTGNSEIIFQWLIMSIRNNYEPARNRLKEFLTNVGRRKFVRPLYVELVKTPDGKKFAKEIYSVARKGYHPITQASIDAIVGF
ncbi:MAG: M1 family metallopeptidase [Pyrinomonadaceae bacterium]|nr:M1 family metallopeptidase [Pyrinomonadaceae bacterium]MCX7639589.1 M1 family metallopeptidase [Pyrinomonadaceae bacterium]MDW8303982.1 M1 family metallopeptidase [Acidobacteriota bacterium]